MSPSGRTKANRLVRVLASAWDLWKERLSAAGPSCNKWRQPVCVEHDRELGAVHQHAFVDMICEIRADERGAEPSTDNVC